MSYKVKAIPKFEKELKRLAKKYPSLKTEYIELVQSLKQEPEQGTPLDGADVFFPLKGSTLFVIARSAKPLCVSRDVAI
jgi:mRNA-degrading endonuclease YafQ of YafQ-DinJ toxin-antitoxin module